MSPKNSEPSNNIELTGYNKFLYEPTETTHGGAGFYIKENLNYVERNDLNLNSPRNFESKFIEIKFDNNKNVIIGCIYRHPNSEISIADFTRLIWGQVIQI